MCETNPEVFSVYRGLLESKNGSKAIKFPFKIVKISAERQSFFEDETCTRTSHLKRRS